MPDAHHHHGHDSKRHKISKSAGKSFAFLAAISLGIISCAAIILFFPIAPAWVVPVAIVAGLGSAISEGRVYWHDVPDSFKILFGGGILPHQIARNVRRQLAKKLAMRELLKIPSEKDPEIPTQPNAALKKADPKKYQEKLEQWYAYEANVEEQVDQLFDEFDKSVDPDAAEIAVLQRTLGILKENKLPEPDLLTEFHSKKYWLGLMIVIALANGLGFAAITYSSCFLDFGPALITLFGAATISTPFMVLGVIFVTAAFAAYSMLMYQMLHKAVINGFYNEFLLPLRKAFEWEGEWKNLDLRQKIQSIVLGLIKSALIIMVILIAVFVTLATAGTYLQSTASLFTDVCRATQPAALLAANLITWIFMLPVAAMFSILNGSSTISKVWASICSFCAHCWSEITKEGSSLGEKLITFLKNTGKRLYEFITSPSQWLALIVVLVFIGALLAHVTSDGAMSCESSGNQDDSCSQLVTAISELMNDWWHLSDAISNVLQSCWQFLVLTPTIVTTMLLSTSEELFTDSNFFMEEEGGHNHGVNFSEAHRLTKPVCDNIAASCQRILVMLHLKEPTAYEPQKDDASAKDQTTYKQFFNGVGPSSPGVAQRNPGSEPAPTNMIPTSESGKTLSA